MFSIDTTDNKDAIKQNGDEVEFSFNTMVYRWVYYSWNDVFNQLTNFRIVSDTISMQLEPTQQMSCSVSNSVEAENNAEIDNSSVSIMNATFELSAQDISLVSVQKFFHLPVPCNCKGWHRHNEISIRNHNF